MNKSKLEGQDPENQFGPSVNITSTRGIKIMVWPKYDEEKSRPSDSVFFYEYHIKIVNESPDVVQLLSRYWKISDGFDRTEEVRGSGVVGQQPVLSPGEVFYYSSYCPLRTPTGVMSGLFEMRDKNHLRFDAKIDAFYLKNKMMLN